MKTLLLSLICWLTAACTYEVDVKDYDMNRLPGVERGDLQDQELMDRMRPKPKAGDGGLLDKPLNPSLIGRAIDFVPALATGAEPVVNGTSVFTQIVPLFETNANRITNPELLNIIIDASPTTFPVSAGQAGGIMSQAILEFASGTAQFGPGMTTVTATGPVTIPEKLIIDVYLGTQINVSASYVKLSYQYVAMKAAAFAPGAVVGPNMHVNASIGYGTNDDVGQVSKTDPFVNLANATSFTVARAKFANALEIDWTPYSAAGGGAVTPMNLIFFSAFGAANNAFDVSIAGNTLPPPRIPWPAWADGVTITNGGAATARVTAKQYLSL